MFTFLLFLSAVLCAGAIGFIAGIKNANSSKVAKLKSAEEALKKEIEDTLK